MSGSRQKKHQPYGFSARAYAIAALMLEGVDQDKWKATSLSHGDVLFAHVLGTTLLRVISVECGLKHILDTRMKIPVTGEHDLAVLWNSLTDGWKKTISERSGVSRNKIKAALGHYKNAAVAVRYGGPLGEGGERLPKADEIREYAKVLQQVAKALGETSSPPFKAEKVDPRELKG